MKKYCKIIKLNKSQKFNSVSRRQKRCKKKQRNRIQKKKLFKANNIFLNPEIIELLIK